MIKTNIQTNYLGLASVALSLVTMLGILVHDMHIDRATTVAVAFPVIVASAMASDKIIGNMAHLHVERASIPRAFTSFRSSLPNSHPPRDDERRHINSKKASLGFGADQGYVWPSA